MPAIALLATIALLAERCTLSLRALEKHSLSLVSLKRNANSLSSGTRDEQTIFSLCHAGILSLSAQCNKTLFLDAPH